MRLTDQKAAMPNAAAGPACQSAIGPQTEVRTCFNAQGSAFEAHTA
jgi:hypothetical protein